MSELTVRRGDAGPEELWISAWRLEEGRFRVTVSSWRDGGIALWRASDPAASVWTLIDGAEVTHPGVGAVTLTDEDAGGIRAFYRVTRTAP